MNREPTFSDVVALAVYSAHYTRPNAGNTLNHEAVRHRKNLLEIGGHVLFDCFAIWGENELLCLMREGMASSRLPNESLTRKTHILVDDWDLAPTARMPIGFVPIRKLRIDEEASIIEV